MVENVKKVILNLGCGEIKKIGCINVDYYGSPDVRHDLNQTPYPWPDNYADRIEMYHVLEHIQNWWPAFMECVRILKPGGTMEIRVPDSSSDNALTYRDHYHIFSWCSFHGILGAEQATNSWAKTEKDTVPVRLVEYYQVPFSKNNWMIYFPWLLKFCASHLRNFIFEQRIIFVKDG